MSIERAGRHERFRVTVDGEVTLVDARRSSEFGLSLVFPEADHRGVCVALAPGSAPGEMLAYLRGRSVPVTVNGRRTGRGAADTSGGAHGERNLLRRDSNVT